jgi:hypothetical protein
VKPNQGREPHKSAARGGNMRAELIVNEMASAVRVLGGDGPALVQNNRASRLTGLPVTTIERLRWKKVKRPFADLVDSVREALTRHNEESLSRAKHEAFIERQRADALAARLSQVDPDFYRPEIDRMRRSALGGRRRSDFQSGGE